MKWFEILIETTHEAAEAVGGLLLSCGVTGWATLDKMDLLDFMDRNRELWDYVDEPLLAQGEGVKVQVYLPDNQQGRDTLSLIKSALLEYGKTETMLNTGSLALTVGSVSEEDWANSWKQYFHPIEIGKTFAVRPSWEAYENPMRSVLVIDPGSAFGTGGHATTRLCMELLEEKGCWGNVLDVGCGSGILAVTALLLGADSALGVDIDENSVHVAETTAQNNEVAERANFLVADLVTGVVGQYDIITANIVADIVIRLTPDIPPLLAKDGRYIVSGIIDDREQDVRDCLFANGFAVTARKEDAGWVAMEAKYNGGINNGKDTQ